MNAKIELDNVSKTYNSSQGKVNAIEKFSLSVTEDEIVCLIGPSGCGKSTIINIIAGYIEQTSGNVRVNDESVAHPDGERCVVFQTDAVFPWMTVKDNISYGLNTKGRNGEIGTINEYLKLVGLDGYGDAWPKELSGGMRKRVELARAYASNPEILLLDEPFGSLDVLTRGEMQSLLMQIWQQQPKTILLVTHDVEEALFLGHRVIVMSSSPGSISESFDVPFRYPRDQSLKLSSRFIKYRQNIVDVMKN